MSSGAARVASALLVVLSVGTGALPAQEGLAGAVSDPTGDTLGITSPQLDAVGFAGASDGATLALRLDFASAPDGVAGLIELDTDQDPTTGAISRNAFLCADPVVLGVEHTVDLFGADLAGETVPIRDASFAIVGQATLRSELRELVVEIPLDLIDDDGLVHASAIVGDPSGFGDCVPDGEFLVTKQQHVLEIPTLSLLALLALALLFAVLGWRLLG